MSYEASQVLLGLVMIHNIRLTRIASADHERIKFCNEQLALVGYWLTCLA